MTDQQFEKVLSEIERSVRMGLVQFWVLFSLICVCFGMLFKALETL